MWCATVGQTPIWQWQHISCFFFVVFFFCLPTKDICFWPYLQVAETLFSFRQSFQNPLFFFVKRKRNDMALLHAWVGSNKMFLPRRPNCLQKYTQRIYFHTFFSKACILNTILHRNCSVFILQDALAGLEEHVPYSDYKCACPWNLNLSSFSPTDQILLSQNFCEEKNYECLLWDCIQSCWHSLEPKVPLHKRSGAIPHGMIPVSVALNTVIAEIFVRVKISYSSVCRLSYARNFRTATVVSDTHAYVYGFRMLLNFVLSAKSTKYTKLNRVRNFVRLQ